MSRESWDAFWMRQVYLIATRSWDPRSKIGAIIIQDLDVLSVGFNSFARKVKDLPERYLDRDLKNKIVCHAEANACWNAARKGAKTLGASLYTVGMPCCNCANAIIQSGITEVVIHKQWPEMAYSEKWVESQKLTKMLFDEVGMKVRVFDQILGLKGLVDGKEIEV